MFGLIKLRSDTETLGSNDQPGAAANHFLLRVWESTENLLILAYFSNPSSQLSCLRSCIKKGLSVFIKTLLYYRKEYPGYRLFRAKRGISPRFSPRFPRAHALTPSPPSDFRAPQ